MAYDEHLADRVRQNLATIKSVEEKKMFGGLAFMIDEKMTIGIVKNELMVRINPELQEKLISKKGVRLMDFTGKSMKGFLFISPEAVDSEKDLLFWVKLTLDYNPLAKASKKKK